jgi:GTPase SAR1 family protein
MLEWAVISTAVAPHIKKYVTEKAAKLASGYADSTAAKLYKRLMPDQKLQKAVEAFVAAFDKELRSTIQNPTLTGPAYPDALKIFLADYDVLEALEKPLDAESELDWDLLKRRWTYLLDSKGRHLIELPQEFDWDDLATRYDKSLQKQALADPELRQVAQALATLQIKEDTKRGADAVERLAGPARGFDLVRYAQSICEAYSFLRFGSLDSDWTVYEGRVSLEHVYVPQSAKSALPPRDLTRDYLKELNARGADVSLEEMEIQKQQYEALGSVPVLEVVDNPANSRLVILGDPGLGKSTLLKYLALRWAHDTIRSLALLVELRRTVHESGEIGFLDYLERGTGQTLPLPRVELDRHLKENDSLVLFDALDEVVEGRRGDVILRIIAFAREYPKARIIVTTRIHGYHPGSSHPEQFRDAQFQQFTLQDFEPEEVDRFITIWHKEAFQKPSDRAKYESRLRKALEDSPSIRELSGNPLLLTMMAILNRVQDLPRDRGRLYERCAELLLKNWDLEKFEELKERKEAQDIKDKLGPEQKMRILELVAAAMQQERTGLAGNIIGEEKLKEIIEKQLIELGVPQSWSVAKDLIWMLRERNFMLAYLGDRQYAFVHRTFLEYFCARDLKYRLEKTTTFTVDEVALLFFTNWRHDEWQEILCLLAGMIGAEYAAKCISKLLTQKDASGGEKAILLAAKCLQEIRELGSIRNVRTELQRAIVSLTEFSLPVTSEKPDEIEKTNSEVRRIREAALQALARGWKEEPATMQWLKERSLKDMYASVRSTAVEELARGWKEEDWLQGWLQERAVKEDFSYVRMVAMRELLRGWKDQRQVVTWLTERATQDAHEFVRWSMVRELARGLKDETGEILAWVKERAAQDESESVRRTAVQELVLKWKDDPEILPFIKERVLSDKHTAVQATARVQLRRGWPNDPEITTFLQRHPLFASSGDAE